MIVISTLALLIWLGLLFARGNFWLCDQRLPSAPVPDTWPDVSVVIPARDEAATIGEVITSHMNSTYPGRLSVFLVDDGSSDGTADIARAAGESAQRTLHILTAPPLEPGWSGKLWAVNAGLEAAARQASDFVLLSDADIRHGPDLLERLVAHSLAGDKALVSVMARLDDRGFWGGLLIPAFIFFFQKLYPFTLVNRAASKVAGAAGGVMLVRATTLKAIGGVSSFRNTLIDDCALAKAIKQGAPSQAIALYLADERANAVSLRDNRSFQSVQKMVARTAFTELDYSTLKLAGTLVGMALVYLAGPLIALSWPLHGQAGAGAVGLAVWAIMALAITPTLRLYDRPAWQGFSLPFAAALYTSFTFLSAWRHWRGEGGAWKGRFYEGAGPEGVSGSASMNS